jgi:hypothetical protein
MQKSKVFLIANLTNAKVQGFLIWHFPTLVLTWSILGWVATCFVKKAFGKMRQYVLIPSKRGKLPFTTKSALSGASFLSIDEKLFRFCNSVRV